MFVALGNSSLIKYLNGGGHWSWFLQYPLGLKALGHRILWIELDQLTEDRAKDAARLREFLTRVRDYGLGDDVAVVRLNDLERQDIANAQVYGKTSAQLRESLDDADLLWNFSCAVREPFLGSFRHKVLMDVDPGHLQVSAFTYGYDLDISRHDRHLTVGYKINDADCGVPHLDLEWRGFLPFVYLPDWAPAPDPGVMAPFSSITQWEWEELEFKGRNYSISKRTAYRNYADLPVRTRRPFDLAANIGMHDAGHDREYFLTRGWSLTAPDEAIRTPSEYQRYIRSSRAEIQCPKPIFRELRTGWISDRSVGYLATGRPVLAEDTGFSDFLPSGAGLLGFTNLEEAIAGVAEIDGNYAKHSRAARELAVTFFDSAKRLSQLLQDSQ